jgi:hypothetical protein
MVNKKVHGAKSHHAVEQEAQRTKNTVANKQRSCYPSEIPQKLQGNKTLIYESHDRHDASRRGRYHTN